jgi:putrescine aminotransferase
LNQLKKEFPRLTEIRQMGLFMGLVFQDSATCMVFLKILLNNGIFTVYSANDKRVLQFLPPLVSTESEVAEILRILRESLNELNDLKSSFLRLLVSLFVRDQNGK